MSVEEDAVSVEEDAVSVEEDAVSVEEETKEVEAVTVEQDGLAVSSQTPVESIIARKTIARVVYVGPILVGLFAIIGGWQGAWSATLGIGVVLANFWLAGAIMSNSARLGLQAYHAAALIGFLLRLGLFVGTVYLIATLVDVDRLAFGISAVVAYLTLLVLEAIAISNGRERDLSWTN